MVSLDENGAPARSKWRLDRTVALVGLMGAGKSSIGKRLAAAIGAPFRDADDEIERAAGMTIPEIFETFGEAHFREGERRVVLRLLRESPHVLATGGGAFMQAETRAALRESAVTVWLRADLDTLVARVGRRGGRPLLAGKNPREVLADLIEARYPTYAEADLVIDSRDAPHESALRDLIGALTASGALTVSSA